MTDVGLTTATLVTANLAYVQLLSSRTCHRPGTWRQDFLLLFSGELFYLFLIIETGIIFVIRIGSQCNRLSLSGDGMNALFVSMKYTK